MSEEQKVEINSHMTVSRIDDNNFDENLSEPSLVSHIQCEKNENDDEISNKNIPQLSCNTNVSEFSIKRRANEIRSALQDIQNADFVAIDLEFTGLLDNFSRPCNIKNYYTCCLGSIPNFLTVQLGICTARRDLKNKEKWTISPYNFYVFPRNRCVFKGDSKTFEWLQKNDFSFDRWIIEGYDYCRLSVVQSMDEAIKTKKIAEKYACYCYNVSENIREIGVQRIFECIMKCDKPIVIHNGFLDILHIFDKFIDDIPPTIPELCAELKRLFPGGIYDTKHIANEGRTKIIGISGESNGTALNNLRNHLVKKIVPCTIEIEEQRYPSSPYTAAQLSGKGDIAQLFHEAGFDAMATAHIFIIEMYEFWKHESEGLKIDQSVEVTPCNDQNTPNSTISLGLHFPVDWKNCEFYKKFSNIIEVSGISPGNLNILKIINETEKINNVKSSKEKDIGIRNQMTAYNPPSCEIDSVKESMDYSELSNPIVVNTDTKKISQGCTAPPKKKNMKRKRRRGLKN